MAEIWQDCAVCHTRMKFFRNIVLCIIIKCDVVPSLIPGIK